MPVGSPPVADYRIVVGMLTIVRLQVNKLSNPREAAVQYPYYAAITGNKKVKDM